MEQATRIEKIKAVETEANKIAEKEIERMGELRPFKIYLIPLEYLIYNKYNWRIITFTKSLERQDQKINPETEEWKKMIEKFLRDSKIDRNKRTMESIKASGQKEVWIITKDWIIIDGNRRAMLLNKLNERYFKAAILPVTLEENRLEVEKLEISFQMWEDKKLDYNPIEKYIKADDLMKEFGKSIKIKDIAEWMDESEWVIKKLISVKETMDSYLDFLWYNWVYTQLDGREDQFINLTNRLSTFLWTGNAKWFEWYTNLDVDELKWIAFDYIRIQFEGKNFRNLAEWPKDKHLFWNKIIWEKFITAHHDFVDRIKEEESAIDLNSKELKAHLDARDAEFAKKAEAFMTENFNLHVQKLKDKIDQKQPDKATDKALDLLEWLAGDQVKIGRLSEEGKKKLKLINKTAKKILEEESNAIQTIDEAIELLKTVKLDKNTNEDKKNLLKKLDEINNILSNLTEQLWW